MVFSSVAVTLDAFNFELWLSTFIQQTTCSKRMFHSVMQTPIRRLMSLS